MTDQRPQAFAYPRASGEERVANIISSHLDQLHVDLDIEAEASRRWRDKLKFGTAIWKTTWDFKEKEIKTQRVAPSNFFPDPLATSMKEARYVFEEQEMALSFETVANEFRNLGFSKITDFVRWGRKLVPKSLTIKKKIKSSISFVKEKEFCQLDHPCNSLL